MHVVELDAKLQMLLHDVLDGDRRRNHDVARLRILGQQRRRIALDLLLLEVGHSLRHRVVILSSASARPQPTPSLVLHFLCLSGQPADVVGRQSLGGPQERRQFDRMALDNV